MVAPDSDLVWVAKTWEARLPPLVYPRPPSEHSTVSLTLPKSLLLCLLPPAFPPLCSELGTSGSQSPNPTWESTTTGPSSAPVQPVAPTASYCCPSSLPPPSDVATPPSPPSSDPSASPSPPLPVAHNTGACPPSCLGPVLGAFTLLTSGLVSPVPSVGVLATTH